MGRKPDAATPGTRLSERMSIPKQNATISEEIVAYDSPGINEANRFLAAFGLTAQDWSAAEV